jgi:DHA2 family lincomycin resistance protein-like MFS transporter
MTTLGPSSSVILAGAILAIADWHMMLWFFCALTVLCFLCGAFLLDNVAQLTYPKLDFLSVVLISFSLLGILYGISTIFAGNLWVALGIMLLGVLFLVLFVQRQRHLEQPLINLQPLLVKPFTIGVMLNMFALIVIFAMNIVTPMFLQSGLGVSAFAASLTLFPAILLSCVISPVAGRIYDKHGARILLPLGFFCIGAACLGLAAAHMPGQIIFLALLYIPVICGSLDYWASAELGIILSEF